MTQEYKNEDLVSHKNNADFNNMAFAGQEDSAAVIFSKRNAFIKIPNDGTFALKSFTYSAWWKPYDSGIGPLWQWTKTLSSGTRIWFEQGKDENDLLFQ